MERKIEITLHKPEEEDSKVSVLLSSTYFFDNTKTVFFSYLKLFEEIESCKVAEPDPDTKPFERHGYVLLPELLLPQLSFLPPGYYMFTLQLQTHDDNGLH